jgi:GNAT superfamily N-acetyltransferase
MTLVALSPAHVLPAAALVAIGVARLRRRVPALPEAWTDPGHVAKVVAGLADRGAGLVALDDGDLVAFKAAILLDGRGGRFAYTPDVGHAAPPDLAGRVRVRLYAELADGWIRSACVEHVVTVLADDDIALATYARLGFGHHVVDLVADLRPIEAGPLPEGVTIRRALPADAGRVVDLDTGLRRHLEASPVFLRLGPQSPPEVHRRRLEDAAAATFVAERDGALMAFLRIGPCATDVATIVRDTGTASVTAAFTRPEVRGSEVASHLLAAAVDWAHDDGYERWAVDHESANGEAARFWARHATPVAISLSRRLAPGTVP